VRGRRDNGVRVLWDHWRRVVPIRHAGVHVRILWCVWIRICRVGWVLVCHRRPFFVVREGGRLRVNLWVWVMELGIWLGIIIGISIDCWLLEGDIWGAGTSGPSRRFCFFLGLELANSVEEEGIGDPATVQVDCDGRALSQGRQVWLGALASADAARPHTARVVEEEPADMRLGGLEVDDGSRRRRLVLLRAVLDIIDDLYPKTSIRQHQLAHVVDGSLCATAIKVFCEIRLLLLSATDHQPHETELPFYSPQKIRGLQRKPDDHGSL
jgi:hypothetical protein